MSTKTELLNKAQARGYTITASRPAMSGDPAGMFVLAHTVASASSRTGLAPSRRAVLRFDDGGRLVAAELDGERIEQRRKLDRVRAWFDADPCDHDRFCCVEHYTRANPHRGCMLR